MLLSPEMGGLVTKMAQSMGFWANLGKNPYFEPFLWLNHPFLGLATFRKYGFLPKGVQDLVAQFRANYFTFHRNTFSKKYFTKNNFIAQTAQEGAKCISRHESFFSRK